eukprot:jgi/Tetstr1/449830/TSEL_036893.t1
MPSGTTTTWDKRETDADVAITDASPSLVSPEAEGPATGRATQRELENSRKRAHREEERVEAAHNLMAQHFGEQKKASNSTASALSNNNKI